MARCGFAVVLSILGTAWAANTGARAQPLPSLPLQVCKDLHVSGKTGGVWESRRDAQHPGRFQLTIDLGCKGGASVDVRNLEIHAQELADTDPGVGRVVAADRVEQVASIGPATTPTVFVTGTCHGGPTGCRFWLMLVDNGSDLVKAPDLVAFLVTDASGERLAYGAGPIGEGDVWVTGDE
jgi:hypothetical protein